jgi:hypothetical protein
MRRKMHSSHNVQDKRSQTFVKLRSRSVNVHASKTKETM